MQRRITRRLLPPGTLHWVTIPTGANRGLEMLVDPRSELGYLRGDHEPWLQTLLADHLEPGGTFVDAGSHCGFFALVAARAVAKDGRVVALEPDADTFNRLVQHARRNHLDQIEPLRAAAWREDGEIDFVSSVGADAGVTGRVEPDGGGARTGVTVPTVTLDGLLGDHVPDAVKIDVEGAELDVLAGAASLVARRETRWIIEVHSPALRDGVADLFSAAGYHVEVTQPVHEVYVDYVQEYVVAVPPT